MFNIASQPMASALQRFAEQSNMELLYTYDDVDGVMGRAVAGEFDHRVAMAILLEDSGLEAVYSSDASATIRVAGHNGM